MNSVLRSKPYYVGSSSAFQLLKEGIYSCSNIAPRGTFLDLVDRQRSITNYPESSFRYTLQLVRCYLTWRIACHYFAPSLFPRQQLGWLLLYLFLTYLSFLRPCVCRSLAVSHPVELFSL